MKTLQSINNKILVILILIFTLSCKDEKAEPVSEIKTEDKLAPISAADMETAVIYEANIRQYSADGRFSSFTKDIPELKKLGVKIIWLMPIYPISEKNRKATGGGFVSDIKDQLEAKKYLGSPYAIANYDAVNPDYGTEQDLRNLIKTAHDNGMYVILDWVANHTGWDHKWITEHPEYYTKNEKGEIMHPEGTDWTDTADLNYDNKELRKAMTLSMVNWVKNFDIDGFRCDVADMVPTDFWDATTAEIRKVKPVFMLAESENKSLFKSSFDMGYNWEGHHIMNELAQGKASLSKWDEYMKKIDTTYQSDDILMNFITNHDENSWNGTVKERMGANADAMLAFSYIIPGMPLIYSGQEYDLDIRLKFFEKDTIPHTRNRVWPIMERLGQLKNNNPALNGGKNAADYKRLVTSDVNVFAAERSKDGFKVYYIANFSDKGTSVTIEGLSGKLKDVTREGTNLIKEGSTLNLGANSYRVLESVK